MLITSNSCFLHIRSPCSELEEKKVRKNDYDPMLKDIYYIDGLDHRSTMLIFVKMPDLLVNDGISVFSLSSHVDKKEVMKQECMLFVYALKITRYSLRS